MTRIAQRLTRLARRAGSTVGALVAVLIYAAPAPLAAHQAKGPPNVVVFLADDLGFGDVRFSFPGDYRTPNIDRLAREGVTFSQAYISGAVCSPSRAGIMTARYQARSGHDFNLPEARDPLPLAEPTVAERLRSRGYQTALFGKWHLGTAAGYRAEDRGFEQAFVFGQSNVFIRRPGPGDSLINRFPGESDRSARPWSLMFNGKPVDRDAYLTDVITQEAVKYIQDIDTSRPFFLVVSHHAPHVPIEATRRYMERVSGIADPAHRTYAAMVTALDDSLGEVESALRAKGLTSNTIVVFLSDNGCPEYLEGNCSNGSLAGYKRDLREGGVRTPMALRWPGVTRHGARFDHPVIALDLGATALAAAGWRGDGGPVLDGVDLRPFLTGAKRGAPHAQLFWRAGENHAVREGRWKYISMQSASGPRVFLYDLKRDPGERTDLAGRQPKTVRRLSHIYRMWNAPNPPPQGDPRTLETNYNGVPVLLAY